MHSVTNPGAIFLFIGIFVVIIALSVAAIVHSNQQKKKAREVIAQ